MKIPQLPPVRIASLVEYVRKEIGKKLAGGQRGIHREPRGVPQAERGGDGGPRLSRSTRSRGGVHADEEANLLVVDVCRGAWEEREALRKAAFAAVHLRMEGMVAYRVVVGDDEAEFEKELGWARIVAAD
jgi:hypothetical protein